MGKEVTVTTDNFDKEVLESDIPVLVDFWAEWCVPCRMIAPVLEEISEEYAGKIKVAKVNVDDAGDIAARYSIISIPTLMVFKNGEEVNKQIGAASRQALDALLADYL